MRSMTMTNRFLVWGLAGAVRLVNSGCEERREGLGGGTRSPVKVKLLTESGIGGTGGGEKVVEEVGEKITTFGTLSGKINVNGMPPNLPPLVAQGQQIKDAVCAQSAVPDESVVVGPGNGLANVFIYLRKIPNVDVPSAPSEEIVVDQVGCKFVPHALIARVGQPLKLVNSDPVAHNVGISGTAISFNQTIPANDKEGLTLVYNRAERTPAMTRCDFHGWMRAWQMAVDHPWAALTGEDGTFTIEGVPAGNMEFVVWHEKAGYIGGSSVKVTILADQTSQLDLQVDASQLAD
ncbi:MAG: hypothetical protein KDA80_10465 [Planctomycetaceae bacterium]|nr:hypothetical protein [Planctomycetaceae bacterium]